MMFNTKAYSDVFTIWQARPISRVAFSSAIRRSAPHKLTKKQSRLLSAPYLETND